MIRGHLHKLLAILCALSLLLCGCNSLLESDVPSSGDDASSTSGNSKTESSPTSSDKAQTESPSTSSDISQEPPATNYEDTEKKGDASSTQVASSETGGGFKRAEFVDSVFNKEAAEQGENQVFLDLSSLAKGYVGVSCVSTKRLRFKVVYGEMNYTYELKADGTPTCYPLQFGNGNYTFIVFQNTTEDRYIRLHEKQVNVTLDSEFEPYIRPSQMVNYNKDSNVVKLANKLGEAAKNEEEVVASIYDYIKKNVKYDFEKAEKAAANEIPTYLPNPDDTLESNMGICFDYAALAAAMLRSQGIPTQMLTGYVQDGQVFHAWNMIYLKESGWITVEIKAPAKTWYTIDLTFAANGANTQFIGSGDGYVQKDVY